MNYSAKDFEADLRRVSYYSDPKKSVKILKDFNSKLKGLVANKYKFGVGDIFEEKKGNKLYIHYPIVSYPDMDIDEFWKVVEKPLSSDVIDLIDSTRINEYWEYEGIEENKKKFANRNVIDIIISLK